MTKPINPYAPRWTHQKLDWEVKKCGMSQKEAVYHAAGLLKHDLTSLKFMSFAMWLKRVLPGIDWADPKTVCSATGLYWNCLDDLLAYVDFCTGGMLELASGFRGYLEDDRPDSLGAVRCLIPRLSGDEIDTLIAELQLLRGGAA